MSEERASAEREEEIHHRFTLIRPILEEWAESIEEEQQNQ